MRTSLDSLQKLIAKLEVLLGEEAVSFYFTEYCYFIYFFTSEKLYIFNDKEELIKEYINVDAIQCNDGYILRDYNNNKKGWINKCGVMSIPCIYSRLSVLKENRFKASTYEKYSQICGIINGDNKAIIDFKEQTIEYCVDGKCIVTEVCDKAKISSNIIDLDGKKFLHNFVQNIVYSNYSKLFLLDNGKFWAIWDKECKIIIDFELTSLATLGNGEYVYTKYFTNKGIIGIDGKYRTEPFADRIEWDMDRKHYIIEEEGYKYFADKDLKFIGEC